MDHWILPKNQKYNKWVKNLREYMNKKTLILSFQGQ